MAISEPERRTILSYQSNVRRIRDAVERYLRSTWSAMESYRDADIDAMVSRVVPVVVGGQRQTATLTTAFIAASASLVLGETVRPTPVAVSDQRGVPAGEVYRRPGVTVWTALSVGKPPGEAISEGLTRLLSIAVTDLQLAKTTAARDVLAGDERVVGFQRVLTGSENCALCVLASTQRYQREELLPIHPGCDCSVRALYGTEDPGQVIDPDRLERLHAEAKRQTGIADPSGRDVVDYRHVMIREHGEYGPTLSWSNENFTGPGAI